MNLLKLFVTPGTHLAGSHSKFQWWTVGLWD